MGVDSSRGVSDLAYDQSVDAPAPAQPREPRHWSRRLLALLARAKGSANLRARAQMFRWRVRGVRAAPSAFLRSGVSVVNPRGLTMEAHSRIGPRSYVKCVPGTVHLGEYACLTEGCWVSSTVSVRFEDHALVGPGCHITDANHGTEGHGLIALQPRVASPVVIGEGAWLGAGAKVLSGVTVGKGAVVGAGAVVTKDVSDYAIVAGVPARVIGHREAT
jgi:acetyltransferase-like isoleucine patch superfamily enzyme